jgi:hypothetical protein
MSSPENEFCVYYKLQSGIKDKIPRKPCWIISLNLAAREPTKQRALEAYCHRTNLQTIGAIMPNLVMPYAFIPSMRKACSTATFLKQD